MSDFGFYQQSVESGTNRSGRWWIGDVIAGLEQNKWLVAWFSNYTKVEGGSWGGVLDHIIASI